MTPEAAPPSDWVVRFAGLVREGGTVLDVAAGAGRHAHWFSARGHRVTAVDRDAEALARCGAVETVVADLEAHPDDPARDWPLAGRSFDAVVVTNYLHRPLFPGLIAALDEGGVLLYETFAAGNAAFGKPSNPAFLLAPGELLDRCHGLDVVAFEDGLVDWPRAASVQRICAVRRIAATDGPSRHAIPSHPVAMPGSGSGQIR